MKILGTLYHIFMMLAPAGVMIVFGFQAIRAMLNQCDLFIVVCLWAIVVVAYKMMLIPSIKDYKEHKAKYRNER